MKAKTKVVLYLMSTGLIILIFLLANFIFNTNISDLEGLKFKGIKKKLFSLDLIVGETNKILYKYGISTEYNDVIIGNDGYLFLGVSNQPLGINFLYGLVDENIVKNAVSIFKKKHDYLDKNYVKSLIVIVPSKQLIYKEKMPARFGFKIGVWIDSFLKYAKQQNLIVLFPKKLLETQEKETYFKTDSHWNHYGSYLVYDKTIDELNKIYHTKLQKIDGLTFSDRITGGLDLSRFLKIDKEKDIHDKDIMWETFIDEHIITRCEFLIDKESKILECQQIKNIATDVNTKSYYTFNKTALNKKKLLWIRDSFGVNNSPLYQATFEEIIQIHPAFVNKNIFHSLVEKEKPDYVIFQVAERSIYNSIYLTDWDQ